VSGSLVVVGLGPGSSDLLTPAAANALRAATDLVGYGPYLDRIAGIIPGQRRHASDNRVEIERARHALTLAAEGNKVAVVSGGDPGVFAMAAAVFEAVEHGDPAWRDLDIHVEPGITAMLAAAAEVGAPLGADFCAVSLSDNLKSWQTIERINSGRPSICCGRSSRRRRSCCSCEKRRRRKRVSSSPTWPKRIPPPPTCVRWSSLARRRRG